jgi:hypothetical protein
MKIVLWIVCCVTAAISSICFRLNKEVRYLRTQNINLQSKIEESLYNEDLLQKYEMAFNTLKKEDSTIEGRWDLLVNGIVSKENRSLKNRGSEDDDDLEIYSASGVKR